MASTNESTLINFSAETENISAVTAQTVISEDMEQRRRMLDTEGEKKRMFLANKVAQSFKFSERSTLKHVPWPTNVWKPTKIPATELAKAAVTNTLHNATSAASSMWSAATAAVGAAVNAVSQFGYKTADSAAHLGHEASQTISQKSHEVVEAASAAGHTLNVKSHEVADVASAAAISATHLINQKSHEAYNVAAATGHTLSVKSHEVAEVASGVAHDAKVALSHFADDVAYTTTKAYALALQEAERRRREVDVDEQYAILNARNAAACIKGSTFEFNTFDLYVPEGVSLHNNYLFGLLEEKERLWRSLPQNSLVAKQNATKLATIAKKSFVKVSAPVVAPAPFVKAQPVDITVKKAFSPAL